MFYVPEFVCNVAVALVLGSTVLAVTAAVIDIVKSRKKFNEGYLAG